MSLYFGQTLFWSFVLGALLRAKQCGLDRYHSYNGHDSDWWSRSLERNKLKGRHCDIVRWTANIGDPALSWINSIIISTFSGSKVSQHLWSYMVIPSLLRILILATAIVYAWWYDHPPIWIYIPTNMDVYSNFRPWQRFLLKWGILRCHSRRNIWGIPWLTVEFPMEFPHHKSGWWVAIMRNPSRSATSAWLPVFICRCIRCLMVGIQFINLWWLDAHHFWVKRFFFDSPLGRLTSSFCRGLPNKYNF